MKYAKFGKFAGLRRSGILKLSKPQNSRHLDAASWLTAQVESGGRFGCAINFDGTGMTAGIHQAIAVFPRALDDHAKANDQGPLWKLLNRFFAIPVAPTAFVEMLREFESIGWTLSADGSCRDPSGGRVSGQEIRLEFSGDANGLMPVSGHHRKRSEYWVNLFSELFSQPETFPIQLRYGEEHFIKRADRTKLRFAKVSGVGVAKMTIAEVCYSEAGLGHVDREHMLPAYELAMAVFWSHSVNAPSIALKKICKAVPALVGKGGSEGKFAQRLIRVLGDTKFGRWDDDIRGGRYQRTRNAAMRLWPKDLFVGPDAVMPKDIR